MLIERPPKRTSYESRLRGPRPALDMHRVPVFRVQSRKLEEFVEKAFGMRDFDFLLATGLKEGEFVEYKVNGELPTGEWQNRANDIRNGRKTRNVLAILTTLVADRWIPPGTYIIDTRRPVDPVVLYGHALRASGDLLSADCVRLKEQHRSDKTFRERVARIDKAWSEQQAATKEAGA